MLKIECSHFLQHSLIFCLIFIICCVHVCFDDTLALFRYMYVFLFVSLVFLLYFVPIFFFSYMIIIFCAYFILGLSLAYPNSKSGVE